MCPCALPSQAHAWVALGKLCLTDEAAAKKCVPLFVQELARARDPAVRTTLFMGPPLLNCTISSGRNLRSSLLHMARDRGKMSSAWRARVPDPAMAAMPALLEI